MKTDIETFFNLTYNDILCNTSYPYRASYFHDYRSHKDIFSDVKDMSVYIHIPFCKNLCRFCEYSRIRSGDRRQESAYVDLLEKQIESFFKKHSLQKLYGLDIGGGTPTSLEQPLFEKVLSMASQIRNLGKCVDDFEPSVEFSFATINEPKIRTLAKHNIGRVSAGIQTSNEHLLNENGREINSLDHMISINRLLKSYGVPKLNLDVMYGLKHQTSEHCLNTMHLIDMIHPEQITLYETRYNKNHIGPDGITREHLYEQYCQMYEQLIKMGYHGRFGQNAFSLSETDEGVSSYLRYRMNRGIAYKGFGVSAQSMSPAGISYNCLKSAESMDFIHMDSLWTADNYDLPVDEIIAKYICIALYSGRFDHHVISEILQCDFDQYFEKELSFLKSKGLIEKKNQWYQLTAEGLLAYGAVAALFWSKHHKEKYLEDKKDEI